MSLFDIFRRTFTWVLNTLFGTIRPFLNPFIGDRPLSPAPGGSGLGLPLTMEPRARLLPRGSMRGGILKSWNTGASETKTILKPPKSDTWQPAIVDVLRMRRILQKASKDQLPIELVNSILDHAEYWPHVSASKEKPIVARGDTAHNTVLVIRTPPICALATAGCEDDCLGLPEPTLLHPARKVIFRIRSRDQGWSSEAPETKGTYQASYTWFDAEIDKEFGPMSHEEPLSRIPWELSSVRFLEALPGHSHSREPDKDEKLRLNAVTGDATITQQQRAEIEASGDIPPPDSDSLVIAAQPTNETNNPAYPTQAVPRLFSHQYLENHKYEIQYNIQSKRDITEHTIVWRYTDDISEDSHEADALQQAGRGRSTGDGRFVRCLKIGDCVSLWAKARHRNWANHVETATIEVYFAI